MWEGSPVVTDPRKIITLSFTERFSFFQLVAVVSWPATLLF